MQVEHLDGTDAASVEPFRAVRVAAGDSVSLAISDRGELRAWGSFRVSFLFVSFLPLSLFWRPHLLYHVRSAAKDEKAN